MTAYVISNLLTSIASCALGLLVLDRGRRLPAARMWAYASFAVAIWSLGEALTVSSTTPARAWIAGTYFMHFGGIMIPPLFVHFAVRYTGLRVRPYLVAMYIGVIALQVLSFQGKLATFEPLPPYRYYTHPLPLFNLFVVEFFGLIVIGEAILLHAWWKAQGLMRQHLKFLLVSTATGFISGATTFLPVFHFQVFPTGIMPATIYAAVTVYAIFRYRLMDISIVIRKTLVYSTVSTAAIVMYVAVIFVLTRVFEGLFESPYVPNAVAAGVIAILFEPLRRRIQDWADQLFPRESLGPRLLREATSTFVHEIKSPLAAISLPAELALSELNDATRDGTVDRALLETVRERLEYILEQSEEAGAKMDALQHLVMSEHRPVENVNLAELVTRALASHKDRLDRARVRVNQDLSPIRVLGTAALLEIAFSNLIKNALEALPTTQDGRPHELRIRMAAMNDHVQIEMSDSGPGIPPNRLTSIFKPYFTLKGSAGMGLGLYITHEIIAQHGGRIQAENAETGGARFVISLPLPVLEGYTSRA